MRTTQASGVATLFLVLAAAAPVAAQHAAPAPVPGGEPMPLHTKALGPFTRPVTTDVPEAQAYFDQGVQMMYAFATRDATRSFREAQARDPQCAMCYWGEAWSWGSYLNAPMNPADVPHAHAAIQRAAVLAATRGSDVERALIDAMAQRYPARANPASDRSQDEAYARAMQEVHRRFPNDQDVATLYAESLFLLEPRRGTRDLRTPEVQRILGVLETTVTTDGMHVGACHLLIHLTEASEEPARGEACADWIGSAIPGASHINHMPSHTWNEIGRWGDSVRANIQAWHSDQKAAIGEGFAIYPTHNLHMLAFAASMDGQGAIAIQAGRDYAKLSRDPMFHVLTLVRFGRFDEILQLTDPPPAESVVADGVWHFGQGYARLRGGDPAQAREHLARVQRNAGLEGQFRFHSAVDLLGALAGILDGEIRRMAGDTEGAIAAFRRAVDSEDRMIYDEPEPLPFAARHWLGAALLDAGRPEDAENAFREDLVAHPRNGWALFGLLSALGAQGKPVADVQRDFDASWARSDTWIRRAAP